MTLLQQLPWIQLLPLKSNVAFVVLLVALLASLSVMWREERLELQCTSKSTPLQSCFIPPFIISSISV
jgi:hypothetical protein